MKLATFKLDGQSRLGVKVERGLIDVTASLERSPESGVCTDIMEVIAGGEATRASLEQYVKELLAENKAVFADEKAVEWEPCVTRPEKIICVGLNYRKHADETNAPYPEVPILFNKFNNTLAGHKSEIPVPAVTDKLDYEVELGIVIGKQTKNVSKEQALDSVFGYCAVNDLSARDLQFTTAQWMLGKISDKFSPTSPYVVTSDEVGDPQSLELKTYVNDEVRQDSNTEDMIFTCEEIVSYISKHLTLNPGDLILTGTPEGVVLGLPEEEQVYLKPGDVVTIEVEKVGQLTNTFVAERE